MDMQADRNIPNHHSNPLAYKLFVIRITNQRRYTISNTIEFFTDQCKSLYIVCHPIVAVLKVRKGRILKGSQA